MTCYPETRESTIERRALDAAGQWAETATRLEAECQRLRERVAELEERIAALGRSQMRISYNKLWKMLIDKNMNKQDLKELSGVSAASIAKLGKGENITTDVLLKICEAMDCRLEDILETIDD